MQTLPTLHGCSLADFLAKDEVGKNEVATAAAAAATISFLIVFIGPPFAKALTMFADWPEHLRSLTF
jgi:16S rRNA G966 N2-methylase RsmD